MIRAKSGIDGPPVTLAATVEGVAIYLDNFSFIRLAKRDGSARKRFVDAVRSGAADLLFSITNAVELTGPQGESALAVRRFLDELGPHWFPVELDPYMVAERELKGARGADSFVASDFVKVITADAISHSSKSGNLIVGLSEDLFRLGPLMDRLGAGRENLQQLCVKLDARLIERINNYRAEFERDPKWLDQAFPVLPWRFQWPMPATFAYVNLIRTLVLDAKEYQLKKGDGADFCHAVMAAAFASVATLDKQWKRRVEALPKPNGLARIFYLPEFDDLLAAVESWAENRQH